MITQEKPSLEDALVHFGIKGMKWGQRKRESTGPRKEMSSAKKAALGAAAVVGTGALLYNRTTRGYALGSVKKTAQIGASAAFKVLRGVGKTSVSVLRKASESLGITGVRKPEPVKVKPKLATIERVKASLTRGREFLTRDKNRSTMAQVGSGFRLPPNLLTDALF